MMELPFAARARPRVIEAKAAAIIAAQRPATFHRTNPGLITLMKQALLAQRGDFRAVLSGAQAKATSCCCLRWISPYFVSTVMSWRCSVYVMR